MNAPPQATSRRAGRRARRLLAAASLGGLAAVVVGSVVTAEAGGSLARGALGRMVMIEAALVTLAAPWLVAATVTRRGREPLIDSRSSVSIVGERLAGPAVAVGAFLLASASYQIALRLVRGGPSYSDIFGAQLVLIAAAAASLGLGLLATVLMAEPVDAAGLATVIALIALAAPLLATPWIASGGAGRPAIEAVLTTSPIVAAASAASLDLFRTEALYRLSPIGQRQFHYPRPVTSSLIFAGAALCLVSISHRSLEYRRSHHES